MMAFVCFNTDYNLKRKLWLLLQYVHVTLEMVK